MFGQRNHIMIYYTGKEQEFGGQRVGGKTRHLRHHAARRTILAFLILIAIQTILQRSFEEIYVATSRVNVSHYHNGGDLFHMRSGNFISSEHAPPSSLMLDMHAVPNNDDNDDDTIYTIGDEVRNEYKQWHILAQNLSHIQLQPNKNWTPTIENWSNHPQLRSHRFPSIIERVQYYMGPWYNTTSTPMYGSTFHNDMYIHQMSTRKYGPYASILVNLYNLNRDALYDCYENNKIPQVFTPYCRDYIDLAILHAEGTANILHFIGDGLPYMNEEMRKYPIFAKVRPICDNDGFRDDTMDYVIGDEAMDNEMCQPNNRIDSILLPLNRKRHYGVVSSVPANDIPWEQKVGKAVWRGKYGDIITHNASINEYMKYALVSNHLNSTVVDAKFSKSTEHAPHNMIGQYMDMKAQLQHKYIISIEGNDVSSGLKWMLFSNSVVFVPPFTMSSWAMEDILQPFVHYIPIKRDMSNVEAMVQWAESHPDETKLISERSTLFIHDLLFHPEAMGDEREVMTRMMERFEQNFGYAEWKRRRSSMRIDWSKHPSDRRDRIPSVEERVRYFMGKWYHKNSNDDNDAVSMQRTRSNLHSLSRLLPLNNDVISGDSLFLASGNLLTECANQNSTTYSQDIRQFCKSSLPHFDERHTADLKSNSFHRLRKSKMGLNMKFANESSWTKDDKQFKVSKRVLLDDTIKILCYGECSRAGRRLNVPYFTGYRRRNDENAILWPFVVKNNAFDIATVRWNDVSDMDFEDKLPRAVMKGGFDLPSTYNSKMLEVARETSNRVDHIRAMLSYRYLLATEPDSDVNEDLLWMLRSTSVVFMPAQRNVSSWLMEEFLQPNVHFVPIAPDYSDIDEQIRWCENNIDEVKLISERSTLFVHDILLDRNSEKDNEEVKFQVMERYAGIFGATT